MPIEVMISAEEVSEGEFVLKNGNDEMGDVTFADGQYTAFVGSQTNTFAYTSGETLHLLFHFDAEEPYLYLYAIDTTRQRQFLAAGAVKEKIAFADSLEISNRESGNPETVSETGKVSVRRGEQSASVTADVTYGEQSFSKTFIFTVWAIFAVKQLCQRYASKFTGNLERGGKGQME